MRNRLPPEATKGVPDEIVQEYNTLCWIGRALGDLGNNPQLSREKILREKLLTLGNTSHESDVQTSAVSSRAQEDPLWFELQEGDPDDPQTPWYNRFAVPEVVLNWIADLTLGESSLALSFGVFVVVLFYILG